MRQVLVICIFLCSFVSMTTVCAQTEMKVFSHLSELDLSPSQKTQVEGLKVKYADLFEYADKRTTDRDQKRTRRRELMQDFRVELQRILTPSQMQTLRTKIRQNSERSQSQKRINSAFEDLGLNEQQIAEINDIITKQKEDVEEIRNSDFSREKKRTEIQEIREETLSVLKELMSQEQFSQFQVKMDRRREARDKAPLPSN